MKNGIMPRNCVTVTLTIKPCTSKEVLNSIHAIQKAFLLFNKYKEIRKATKDYIFKFENPTLITNFPIKIHKPHYHVIYVVKPTYFISRRYYLTQSNLQKLWKKALQVDYDPFVSIQKTTEEQFKKVLNENPDFPDTFNDLDLQDPDDK